VETTEQAALLVELGCSRAQGFLYSQAVSFNDLVRALDGETAQAPFAAA